METSTVRGLSIGHTILGVFVITTVMVIISMVTNCCAPAFERIARIIVTVLFIVIIAGRLCRTGHDFRRRHHNRLQMMVPT